MTGTLTHGEQPIKINGVGLGDIAAPRLLVYDPVLPPRGEALRDAIPAAELLVLPRPVGDGLVSAPVSALVRRARGGRS